MKKTKTVLGRLLLFVGSFLCFAMASASVSAATNIGLNISTDGDLTVGGALKFTNGAVNNYILKTDALGNASWSSLSNVLSIASTDDLAEGLTNLYYSDARVDSYIDTLRGGANGLAELDGFGFVPMANLPAGVPDGVASLDATGKIYSNQIPAIAINETYTVADLAERDLLTPNKGDVSIVIDTGSGESRSYIWDGVAWIELLTPLELYLSKANNLGDLANISVARSNLGLGVASTPTFNNLALTGLTTGSILFSGVGGFVSQDNANFFWDDANNRLGLKTSTPAYTLDVAGDIKVGDTYRLFLGQKTGGDPVGVNGAMYYNDSLTKFRCYENGGWKDCDTSTASLALSSLNSATATHSFDNGDFKQQWDWSLTSAGNLGMEFGEVVPSVATGKSAILSASTLVGSTVMPFYVKNLGNGFSFRVDDEANDTTSFVIDDEGRVGIGTDFFDPIHPETLKVEAPFGSHSYNSISAYGDVDSYLQINIKNRNAGLSASSDIVATADNGNEDDFYINMGINSSAYNNPDFSISGPNDGYLYVAGENLLLGTATLGKDIIFHTSGTVSTDEKMRITGAGEVGIGTSTPGAKLDVKGDFRLSGSNSGYFGLAVAADAGNVTYTLPSVDGVVGQSLITNGFGVLSWGSAATDWQRVGTILSPTNIGDDITSSGDIYTSAGGTITSSGLLTSNAGLTVSGATISLNNNSNFDTNINTGTSTGIVTIGNSLAGAIDLVSASSINLTAANSVFSSDGVNFVLQAAGVATTANVQIGAGGLGSATPDLLVLDNKNTVADPAGTNGAMYYNSNLNKLRCYEAGAWKDCDKSNVATLQSAYNNNGTITTAAGAAIDFILANGDFTASGAGSVNLTPSGASSFTSGDALTFTAGASSTWGTSAGDLTLQVAGAGNTGLLKIGAGGVGSATPDLLGLDIKNTASDPVSSINGAMYYNDSLGKFRCHENGSWKDCDTSLGSLNISSLLGAAATHTIANGDYKQQWDWALNSANNIGMEFGESSASVATGKSAVLSASTLLGSTAMPLYVKNLGDGFSFRVDDEANDVTSFVIDNTGRVGIGTDFFDPVAPESLKVEAPAGSSSYNSISAYGNVDNYLQINIKNRNAGPNASSDIVATANNGTEDNLYVNMGIASSGYNSLTYPLYGPNDGYIQTVGENLIVGTGTVGKDIIFHTGGFAVTDERVRITGDGKFGINTSAPGSELDVKGTLRLSGSNSGYVGFAPAADAGSTTYSWPSSPGVDGQALITNGLGALAWGTPSRLLQRVGTILSPFNDGDDITTSGDIYTSAGGIITSDGLLTASLGFTSSNATINLNNNSNFNTNINTGTSTGLVTIGNSVAGAINIVSGSSINLTAANSVFSSDGVNFVLQASGAATTANVQIGAGGLGSDTPDLLVLDIKTSAIDPISGTAGAMYYNNNLAKFRCYENSAWKDCDTTGGTTTLDTAYNNGGTITTAAGVPINFLLTNGDFQASGAGSVNLTPTGASSFTSGGALTLTGGAASTWSTSSGALSISSATASTWGTASGDLTLQVAGTGTTGSVKIGAGGIGSATPDLFALDVKSTAGDPTGYSGAMYYNAVSDTFRCYVGGGWHDCATAGGVTAGTLQDVYTNGPTLTTTSNVDLNFILTSGNFTTSGAGSVNLTPTGASSFTSGGALTLTGGAASIWSTSVGNLTLDSAAALNLGTSTATAVSIGKTGISTVVLGTLQSGNNSNAGLLKLGDGTNNYISLVSPAIASDYTLTLPVDDGLNNQTLITDGSGVLSWASFLSDPMTTRGDLIYRDATNATTRLGRGTVGQFLKSDGTDIAWSGLTKADVGLSNVTNDEQIPKSIGVAKGDIIAYTASGTPVRLPLGGSNGQVLTIDTAQATGIKWSSVATNVNSLDFTEFKDAMTLDANTSIQLGGRIFSIIDSGAGALSFATGGALTLSGGAASSLSTSSGALSITSATAATWGTSAGNLSLQVAGIGTSAQVRIGSGAGSDTPDLLVLDNKNTIGDPIGTNGAMYYNSNLNKLRCFENGAWRDCDQAITTSLQNAYANGGTITTAAGVPINFVLTNGNFTTSGAGSVNLTPTGASSFTSGGSLTLTGGADSIWSTSVGNLTLDSAATLNLGTSTATGVSIGKTGISTIVLGTLQSGDNSSAGLLKLGDGTNNYISLQSPAIASDYTLTLPSGTGLNGQVLSTNGSGALSWLSVLSDPMTTRGDLIYRDATNVTARLGVGTLGQVLRSDGSDIVWQTLTKTDVGLSNVTNDAQIPKSIGLAKGDIIAYTASGTPVRLPVGGVNGQVLTVDTAQATGIKWSSVATNANSLDFTEFKDAMTLDASTSIQLTGFGLSIIDSGAGALSFATGGALTLSGGAASSLSTSSGALSITSATAATWGTSSGNLSLQVGGALTTANVQIGSGGLGSDTPDLLVLDNKNTVGDPIIGTNGAMYYNSNLNKLRCFENSAWKDCDTSSASTTWQKVGTNISPGTAGDDLLLNSGETLTIGGGTVISRHLSATAALDFPNVLSRTCSNLTIIVTGAAVGDTVVASPDNSGGVEAVVLTWNAYVSATNTVTVRVCNPTTGTINPTSNTWRADVWQH